MDERTHARYMYDIAYFLSKMEAEPNSGYFIPIALAYNKLEKYDETIAMCKTAVERFPSNCAAKTFLAEAYVYKGLFDQARDLLFDVTAEDDNNYKALKLLGIICKEKGNNTEALKYLTGAFIRAPEDEEVRKMIEELGGTLNHSEIYDARMKKQTQNVDESEEDEELKTYQEIDKRIRNAEIIMADLVSDTSIYSRGGKEQAEEADEAVNNGEESLELGPVDTLPAHEENSDSAEHEVLEEKLPDETAEEALLIDEKIDNNLAGELQEDNITDDLAEEQTDDLLRALSSEEEPGNDLAEELQEENITGELTEEQTDDLLHALSGEEEPGNDLVGELQEENITGELAEEQTDDLLQVLSGEEESGNDLAGELQEDNITGELAEEQTDDLLHALSGGEESGSDLAEELYEASPIEENINNEVAAFNDNADNLENTDIPQDNTVKENTEREELYNRQVPSSLIGMTYDNMIEDDMYGKMMEENYRDDENPAGDLGDSAPFTQTDIMDEILSAVGMTQDDMADDERIDIPEKDRRLMRLENFLEKVQHNKENV